jgi:calcineurin-like phosphoesterase family protein
MTIWFSSDHHFGHERVIGYSGRPFKDAEEMGEALVENWNAVVQPGDVTYDLGDFAFLRPDAVPPLVKRLRGQIHLVRGNHDRFLKDKRRDFGFAWVGEYKEVKVGEQKVVLCHYPFLTWNGRHHGSWSLHGHSHGSLPRDFSTKRLDIGVDAVAALLAGGGPRTPAGYRPISYEEVSVEMGKHGIAVVDHHEARGGEDGDEPDGPRESER